MPEEQLNLQVLKGSRKAIKAGDIFVLRPKGHPYYFGRVVRTDTKVGGFEGGILIYIYGASSATKDEIPDLDPKKLLIPPVATDRRAWSKGYFQTVAHKPLMTDDVLPVHCFKDLARKNWYHALDGSLMPEPPPGVPVGNWALAHYRAIDDKVSEALGLPLAPE